MTSAVVFAYSEVGVRCLGELLCQGVDVPLVFTHPDDPGEHQWFASVAELGQRHGLRVEMPDDPNAAEWIAEGQRLQPDFLFSFYYRYMLKTDWLAVPRRGALNMHGSLLPKYRGRAPVHWAILNGESSTGASLHYMLEKPDAGALVDQAAVTILENDTALDVSVNVASAAEEVLRRSLPKLIDGTAPAQLLDLRQGSYFGRRRPEDGRIDWRQSARQIHDLVRAVAPPFPGAFAEVNGLRLDVLETRVDPSPLRYPLQLPCLYAAGSDWFVDCTDGCKLKIVQLETGGRKITPHDAPPNLAAQPLSLIGT